MIDGEMEIKVLVTHAVSTMHVQLLAHRFLSKMEGFAISRSQFTVSHYENESAVKVRLGGREEQDRSCIYSSRCGTRSLQLCGALQLLMRLSVFLVLCLSICVALFVFHLTYPYIDLYSCGSLAMYLYVSP